MGSIIKVFFIIILSLYIGACDIISGPSKKHISLSDRIQDFQLIQQPHFNKQTDILWNTHGVPYIIAHDDADAAFALGMVQAHLRLGQMEVARHIVQGRLSESLGFYFNDIDHTLRIMNFYKAVPNILAKMPKKSKQWLKNFIAGINYYKQNLPRKPYDFNMFAFNPNEQWKEADAIALGKLGGTDLHWIFVSKILPLMDKINTQKIMQFENMFYNQAQTGFSFDKIKLHLSTKNSMQKREKFLALLSMFNKSGSNAYAISGKKSVTKKPIFAADPHLGIFLPNFWLMAGIQSPSMNVVGMMAPGTPVFAFGRNKNIAWGGTNLRAIQSHFVDITKDASQYAIKESEVMIKNRLWYDKKKIIRDSDMGVIISDSKLFPELKKKTIALKWLGHYPTDEITAMLKIAESKNGTEFQNALKTFGLPAQNMIFADIHGNIGNVMATSLTNRPAEFPKSLWSKPVDVINDYKIIHDSTTLPSIINPQSNFVVSANNIPTKNDSIPLISYYTTSDERIKRLQAVLTAKKTYSVADIMVLQKDTYSESAVALRDALISHINRFPPQEFKDSEAVIMNLRDWNGYYTSDSRGALLIEGFFDGILKSLYRETKNNDLLTYLDQDSRLMGHSVKLLQILSIKKAKPIIIQGLNRARQLGETHYAWGDIHKMKLGHIALSIPVIGNQYVVDEFPAAGNRETLMKTAAHRTPHPHYVNYGSNARQISDLSHIDNNYFVLLGGQDSFQGADNFIDQVYLWRIGHYIQMPLSDKKIKNLFPFKTIFLKSDNIHSKGKQYD